MTPTIATDSMPNFAGKVIDAGRLRLLDCIGTGAYGKVYRAVDTTTPKSDPAYFAIKCLRVPEPASLEAKLQLREFTNHLAVSHHPNIVSFHKLLHPNGDFRYVVLDLCPGGDLFEAIVERNFFVGRTDKIKLAFLQLVDAISFCHQHSVYHRDIKPENVLCSKDGTQVYLADFGLSTQAPVSRDFRCGSVEYMSPDCIAKDFDFRNRSYSTRCNDIWALGIVLVNMITQRTPWNYARPTDACFAAFLDDEDYFLRVLPVSLSVNAILKRVFQVDPLRRVSLSDLRADVQALEDCFAIPDSPKSGIESPVLRRSQSRSSALSADIGVLCIDDLEVPLAPPVLASILVSSSNPGFIDDGSDGNESEEDEGPITPETHPVKVDVEVPDIDQEEGVDLGLVGAKSAVNKSRGTTRFFKRFVGKGREV